MSLPDINFEKIRPHDGSRHTGFEELTAQLAALEDAPSTSTFFRKGRGGDAGVECFRRFADGSERGWQAKYLFSWDAGLPVQLNKSIRTALDKHPKLTEYVVCIPFDLPDVRPKKGRSALQKWTAWKANWEKTAKSEGRELTIFLWGKNAFSLRLAGEDPAYAGRLLYWFGQESFTVTWFKQQFDKARAALGSRYTPQTNVNLPIRKSFLAMARDSSLQATLEKWFLGIKEEGRGAVRAVHDAVPEGQSDHHSQPFLAALNDLSDSFGGGPIGSDQQFPLQTWTELVRLCLELARAALYWALELPPGRESKHGIKPQRRAQHCLSRLLDLLDTLHNALESDEWHLANVQAVLLHGPAGIGKSHLLADVVEHQVDAGRPSVLILGSSLIDAEPWRQIMTELDLPATQQVKHFLGSLDAAAEAAGVRAIICVDALNERYGLDIWPSRLAAFLKVAEPFRRICVVLSCRSTFIAHLIPEDLNGVLARIEHPGFSRDGGAAAKLYLSKRGIVRPGAPNLVPEFENPLFLKTCCDLLEKEGRHEIPKGLRGVTAIFSFYHEAVAKALTRRMKLDPALQIVPRAIDGFAQLLLDLGQNYTPRAKAIELFESVLPSGGKLAQSLLTQLESEGLLSVEVVRQENGSLETMVRFTFERLSDHALASRVLDQHLERSGVEEAFAPGSKLHNIMFGEESYRFSGVIEAIAVQLPERTGFEILEVGQPNWITRQAFLDSLLWRDQAHFSDRTLELLSSEAPGHVSDVLIAVATEPANKFNARYIDRQLRQWSMPQRDQRWSVYIADHNLEGDAVEILISWAFENGMEAVEDDRAELAAIMLAWFLTTSNRAIRDRATKALATLFAKRLELASSTLRSFAQVDDLYVLERLLAAAYGGLLQGVATSGLGELAQTAYESVFVSATPPINALVRDNAYGIIKCVEMRGELPAGIDAKVFEPPYSSPWPVEYVPDEVIETYKFDYGKGNVFHDPIVSSAVNHGDFARYVVDNRIDDWSPAPIGTKKYPTDREVCQNWLKHFANQAAPEQHAAFEAVVAAAQSLGGERPYQVAKKDAIDLANQAFKATLTSDQWEDYRIRAKHYIAYWMFSNREHESKARFDRIWGRRWVCKKAHDLGWTPERFGQFDRRVSGHGRNEHLIERIGKKYQWIALYELTARMADNLAFLGGYGECKEGKNRRYGSALDVHLRQIDPSLLITKTHYDGWAQFGWTWWVPVEPQLRPVEPAERMAWLDSESDILNDASLIDLMNPKTGERWLALSGFSDWRQWGLVDDRKEIQRDTWLRLTCIVVRKKDEAKLVRSLSQQILTDPHSLPKIELHGDHHLGEYSWHPTVSALGDWNDSDAWPKLIVPARATVADYMCARRGYDYSIDQTVHLTLPAPWLAKGLGLHLSDGRRLNYVDSANRIVFFDPSVSKEGPTAALVDRQAFLAMLKREGLSALWVIAGEKSVYGGSDPASGFGGRVLHTGVYRMKNDRFERTIHREREHPTKEELQRLFGDAPIPHGIVTRSD